MLSRYIFSLLIGFTLLAGVSAAQTPVEKVVFKYDDVRGSKDFIATGGPRLALGKSLLKRTPVASLASDVDEIMVLKMGNASQQDKTSFLSDLHAALKTYEYHGIHPSDNGNVDVYVHKDSSGHIVELVIYNPELYNLNVLHGSFPLDALMKLQ